MLSMSTSLVAVFIPILLMGGIVGRLFREFAVTLSVAIAVSLLVSLTTTPMMCAKFLRPTKREKHGRIYRFSEWIFDGMLKVYSRSLRLGPAPPASDAADHDRDGVSERLSLRHRPQGILSAAGHGRVMGSVQAAQDISFAAMKTKDEAVCGHR